MNFPRFLRLGLASGIIVAATAAENSLTPAEKSAGWQLLFDGHSFDGWRGYRETGMPAEGWEIRDGAIRALPNQKGAKPALTNEQKLLITEKKFNDFELTWEWKIA